jgi:hypothetical protein
MLVHLRRLETLENVAAAVLGPRNVDAITELAGLKFLRVGGMARRRFPSDLP